MALLNTNESKLIPRTGSEVDYVSAGFIFLNIYITNAATVEVEGRIYASEGDYVDNIVSATSPIAFGTCETDIESPTFAMDVHNFALSKLPSGFEIVNINTN